MNHRQSNLGLAVGRDRLDTHTQVFKVPGIGVMVEDPPSADSILTTSLLFPFGEVSPTRNRKALASVQQFIREGGSLGRSLTGAN